MSDKMTLVLWLGTLVNIVAMFALGLTGGCLR